MYQILWSLSIGYHITDIPALREFFAATYLFPIIHCITLDFKFARHDAPSKNRAFLPSLLYQRSISPAESTSLSKFTLSTDTHSLTQSSFVPISHLISWNSHPPPLIGWWRLRNWPTKVSSLLIIPHKTLPNQPVAFDWWCFRQTSKAIHQSYTTAASWLVSYNLCSDFRWHVPWRMLFIRIFK